MDGEEAEEGGNDKEKKAKATATAQEKEKEKNGEKDASHGGPQAVSGGRPDG